MAGKLTEIVASYEAELAAEKDPEKRAAIIEKYGPLWREQAAEEERRWDEEGRERGWL